MKWDDLRIFLELSRHEKLMNAGQALGLDPATVGRRITSLERALGNRLFDRSPRGYHLTEAGRNLVGPATAMEDAALTAARMHEQQTTRLTGNVRIGAPEGVASTILAPACAALAQTHPELRIELVALPRVFSLSQREADLAIALSPPTAGRLSVKRVADYGLHLYATPKVIAQHRLDEVETLKDVPFVGYISDMIYDKELDYVPLVARDLRPRLTSTSLAVQLGWTVSGAGVCVLPDFIAAQRPELRRFMADRVSFTRSFYLIRHEDDLRVARISRTAEAMTEALQIQLRQLS